MNEAIKCSLLPFLLASFVLCTGQRPNKEGFRFASYFTDHMVLSAYPQHAIIWGFGEVGQEVNVLFRGTPYITVVKRGIGGQPIWNMTLPSTSAGGPYTILTSSVVRNRFVTAALKDVLFGDVWICGGQSNMQFTVGQSFRASEELDLAAEYQKVRIFTVGRMVSEEPLYDLPEGGVEQSWSLPSKETLFKPIWSYFSAICWMFGRKLYDERKRPVGLISSNWGGTNIEAWSSPRVLKQCHEEATFERSQVTAPTNDVFNGTHQKSVLWNAMIHPFLQMNIFGVIWYQGEDNAASSSRYACLFPAMIADWRTMWHSLTQGNSNPLFPFGFVQLAPNGSDPHVVGGFPAIRFSQTANFGRVPNTLLPNTFMAVAMDLPDLTSPFGTIHPRDKVDVADRLLLGALNIAYKQNVAWTGPLMSSLNLNRAAEALWEITVTYDKSSVGNQGLELRSPDGFEVLIKDQHTHVETWKPLKVSFSVNNVIYIYITLQKHSEIRAVRYAWRNYPCLFKMCGVYDKASGLPSPPWMMQGPFLPGNFFSNHKKIMNYL